MHALQQGLYPFTVVQLALSRRRARMSSSLELVAAFCPRPGCLAVPLPLPPPCFAGGASTSGAVCALQVHTRLVHSNLVCLFTTYIDYGVDNLDFTNSTKHERTFPHCRRRANAQPCKLLPSAAYVLERARTTGSRC